MARQTIGVGTTVSIGEIEGATLVTAAETIAANDNDTTIPTSAAVKDYADSVAGTPTAITVANEATDTTCFPLFVTAATGDLGPKTNTGLTFNSNTGVLGATGFSGPLTGDVTGNVSGTAATVTGATQASITTCANLTTVGTLASGNATAIVDAGTTDAAGKLELATSAEVLTGTDTARAVTPAGAAATYTPIIVDGTPGTDHTTSGFTTATFNAGATIAAMDLVYMASDGEWALTDADAEATAGPVMLAIALAAGTDGNPLSVALPGPNAFVRDDTWNWTPGSELYVDTATAGQLTATKPSGTDDVVRIVGYAVTADVIHFNPSNSYHLVV